MNNIIDFNSNNDINNITIKNFILFELIKNQLNVTNLDNKFTLSDLKRVVNNLPNSIFTNDCCIWSGSIINSNNNNYISFFIKNKKKTLHRLLYCNFINELHDNEYLQFICNNKGTCCTLNHIKKISKKIKKKNMIDDNINNDENNDNNDNNDNNNDNNDNNNIVYF